MPETPTSRGCPWPVSYADCSGWCNAYENWPETERWEAQQRFEEMAADLLDAWTGNIFGLCEVTLRPCRDDCASGGYRPSSTFWGRGPGRYDPGFPAAGTGPATGGWLPVLLDGRWMNISCGCTGACRCGPDGAAVLLLPGPVADITEVRIDGQSLPETAYTLRDHRRLIRLDGGIWPACQDPTTDEWAQGSFLVSYLRGVPVPIGGQVAAGRLACELALAACGSAECVLPRRTSTVTRQGVTLGFMDTFEDLTAGHTGIWSIDAWTTSVNRPIPRAGVRSPDVRRRSPWIG